MPSRTLSRCSPPRRLSASVNDVGGVAQRLRIVGPNAERRVERLLFGGICSPWRDSPGCPELLLGIFGIPDPDEVWIRILGSVLMALAISTSWVEARRRLVHAGVGSMRTWLRQSVCLVILGVGATHHRAVRRGRPRGCG